MRRSLDWHVLDAGSVLQRKDLVVHELTEEHQLALFDSTSGQLVIVNELGRVVWTMLDGKTSLDVIAREIANHVVGAPDLERVQDEVLEFARQLLERGAVLPVQSRSER